MTKLVEFFFDVGSPTAYLAWSQLPEMVQKYRARLEYKPILLGGLFKAIDNVSPVTIEAKRKYMLLDIERCAAHWGVNYRFNPHFPINTLTLMRGAVAAKIDGSIEPYLTAVFPALWSQGLDMNDPEIIDSVLTDAGLDAARIFRQVREDDVKQGLIDFTTEAVERGAFGAPTMFVGDEMFFGQDRLDYVERALSDQASP